MSHEGSSFVPPHRDPDRTVVVLQLWAAWIADGRETTAEIRGGEWMMVPSQNRYRLVGAQANDAGLGLGARAANKRKADTDTDPALRKKRR